MKWISHKALTGALVFAVTNSPASSIIAALASVIPDAVEGHNYQDPEWRRRHRQTSHWFVIYAVLFLALMGTAYFLGVRSAAHAIYDLRGMGIGGAAYLGAFIPVGCLCHIAQDAICGQVPSMNRAKRIGVRLFRVGSPAEYAIVTFVTVSLLIIA